MRTLGEIGDLLEGGAGALNAQILLEIGEDTLKHWISAKDQVPLNKKKEGFRLLALHRQGAKGDPSFNACRETCRELAYHYNLITLDPGNVENPKRLEMMQLVARHLFYFVGGKIEQAQLGEFCCSSRPMRANIGA
jgi:hypothetical protein